MVMEKKTLDFSLPGEMLERLRKASLEERVPMIVAALTALVGDHAFVALIAPNDDGQALALGNRSPEAIVNLIEEALKAARAAAEEPDGAQVH